MLLYESSYTGNRHHSGSNKMFARMALVVTILPGITLILDLENFSTLDYKQNLLQ